MNTGSGPIRSIFKSPFIFWLHSCLLMKSLSSLKWKIIYRKMWKIWDYTFKEACTALVVKSRGHSPPQNNVYQLPSCDFHSWIMTLYLADTVRVFWWDWAADRHVNKHKFVVRPTTIPLVSRTNFWHENTHTETNIHAQKITAKRKFLQTLEWLVHFITCLIFISRQKYMFTCVRLLHLHVLLEEFPFY